MSKTYLVTGAAGFIGSSFVESCEAQGISVIGVDKSSHFQDRPEHRSIRPSFILDRDDFFDGLGKNPDGPEALETHTGHGQVDAVIHLGAVTDTRETDLKKLNRLNFQYSQRIWNWTAAQKIPLIYASSAATYGDGALGYLDNESNISRLRPLNAYAESKQQFDLWALNQESLGNHPPTWAGFKFFNVYGFGEGHKGFMASVVFHAFDQIRTSGQVTLFRSHRKDIPDGHQKRDFVSVDDVVQILHFALGKPIQRGIFNLGTGHARTFLDLARAVYKALGKEDQIQFKDTPVSLRNKYQYFTEAEITRLRAEGYSWPFLSLEEGVNRYVRQLLSTQ